MARYVFTVSSSLVVAAHAAAQNPVALTLQVGLDPVIEVALDHRVVDGVERLTGRAEDPADLWSAIFDFRIDRNYQGGTTISAPPVGHQIQFHNHGSADIDAVIKLDFPVCPAIQHETELQALLRARLLTDELGGSLSSFKDKPLWSALVDGQHVRSLPHGFFQLHTYDQATRSFRAKFGIPHAARGPDALESIGFVLRMFVSDKDVAVIDVFYRVSPTQNSFMADSDCTFETAVCRGDINKDGYVDSADLNHLLDAWDHRARNMPEDLNGDGQVDNSDLVILMAAIGDCP